MSLTTLGFVIDSMPVALDREQVIEFFEGERIVLMRSPAKDPYLRVWFDTDGTLTRWFVLRITDNDLGRFLTMDVTLRDLMLKARDGHLYVVDTKAGSIVQVAFLRVRDIPQTGLPTDESYYDESLTPTCDREPLREQLILLDGSWTAESLAGLERTYTQVYAYNSLFGPHSDLNIESLRDRFLNYRFVGSGWSHVTAADQVVGIMPTGAKPQFSSCHLSSPGAVRYSVESVHASSVRAALRALKENGEEIEKRYNDLHNMLLEINRVVKSLEDEERPLEAAEILATPKIEVKDAALRLARVLGQIDPERVWLVAGTDVNGGELIANYYRRLNSLYRDAKSRRAVVV